MKDAVIERMFAECGIIIPPDLQGAIEYCDMLADCCGFVAIAGWWGVRLRSYYDRYDGSNKSEWRWLCCRDGIIEEFMYSLPADWQWDGRICEEADDWLEMHEDRYSVLFDEDYLVRQQFYEGKMKRNKKVPRLPMEAVRFLRSHGGAQTSPKGKCGYDRRREQQLVRKEE